MPDSTDVLFLAPPMRPVFRPLDIIYTFFQHSKNTSNIISLQLGLLSMAAYLREEGYSCGYHDLGHFKGKPTLVETVDDLVKRYDPKIIALTSYTSNFNAALDTIKIIKKIDSNILICVGGPHVTFLDKHSIDESGGRIDIVVRGEGERTMRDIVDHYTKKDSLQILEDEVRGITTKNKRTDDQPLLTKDELGKLPPMAFDLIPKRERNNFIYIPLTATRGCAYNCTFCTNPIFWRGQVRFRPLETVIEEVSILEDLFRRRLLEFSDTILPIKMEYFESLVSQYLKCANTPVQMVLTRANLTDKRRLELIKKLIKTDGYVSIGVENGSPRVLELMGKPSWEVQLQALKKINKHGLNSIPTWMVGFCGENLTSMHQNLDKLEYLNRAELIRSIIINIWIPNPGSQPFVTPQKFGVKIHTFNWDFYDRAVFPPPYSLYDPDTGTSTLSNLQIWAYYLSMVALQNDWSNRKLNRKGTDKVGQLMKAIFKSWHLLFHSPAGESNVTLYEELFTEFFDHFGKKDPDPEEKIKQKRKKSSN